MTNICRIPSWAGMREKRTERLGRALVCEERLRATAGLREPPALTSWRGRSGRRYVVGVHAASEPDLADLTEAVVLAVQRSRDGVAELVGAAAPGSRSSRRDRSSWLAAVRGGGATELHVHRLADNEAERLAVVADLVGSAA
ncbi:MAG: hypothetical protein JWR08_648 [Enterovirga sp.]|jgi:hypothetical protein|nr:hypothetical protein [Enterovirga sp.]